MTRVCHLLPVVLAVLTLAKEQQRNPYDSQRPLSPSDAARRFDLTSEAFLKRLVQSSASDYSPLGDAAMSLQTVKNKGDNSRSIDDQLRNGEISRVASRDPSTLSQNDKEMFRNRIYRAIMRIAPDEQMAQMMRQKLENFVKCMATSYRRSYSGGRDRRE
ncbi:hypothetical protein MRX96_041390 [Rhipicephalus microplus]